MGFSWSSAIQILHAGNGDLILHFPPEYLVAIPLAVIGFPLAIVFAILIKQTGFKPVSILFLAGFIPFVLCIYTVTQTSTLMFSRADHNLVVEDHAFFRTTKTVYPLAAVDHAEVAQDDGRSHMLYIALTSGDRIPTGSGWTSRKGHFQAANAANQFLLQIKGSAQPTGMQAPAPNRGVSAEEAGKAFIEQTIKAQKQKKQQ
jgi:hypothetical protein